MSYLVDVVMGVLNGTPKIELDQLQRCCKMSSITPGTINDQCHTFQVVGHPRQTPQNGHHKIELL